MSEQPYTKRIKNLNKNTKKKHEQKNCITIGKWRKNYQKFEKPEKRANNSEKLKKKYGYPKKTK